MKIKEFTPSDRPRERFQRSGPQVLSNAELLAILLKTGTKKHNVLEISHQILSKYSLNKLAQTSISELSEIHGIGKIKATQILATFELATRISTTVEETLQIFSSKDIAQMYLSKLRHTKKEHVIAVFLDTKNRVITDQIITIGLLNESLVHPREVFHAAIKHAANSIIVLHNHPSGDPTPSEEDLNVTKILQETGELLQIPLLDHVIIGQSQWWSWKEREIHHI